MIAKHQDGSVIKIMLHTVVFQYIVGLPAHSVMMITIT